MGNVTLGSAFSAKVGNTMLKSFVGKLLLDFHLE